MSSTYIYLSLFVSLTIVSCSKNPEELNLDPKTEARVNILQDELQALRSGLVPLYHLLR